MIGGHQRYTALTGRVLPSEQLDFYRLRRDLADPCSSGSWFCKPHEATADTELSWHGAVAICKRLSAGTPGAALGFPKLVAGSIRQSTPNGSRCAND